MSNATARPVDTETVFPQLDFCYRPMASAMIILVADLAALWLMLRMFLAEVALPHAGAALHLRPLLALFVAVYWICDLYPGITISPMDDLKRICMGSAFAFLLVSVMLSFDAAPLRSLLLCFAAGVGVSAGLAASRSLVRRIGSRFPWWGYPVALLGGGEAARSLLRKLKSQPHLGFRPVALVSNHLAEQEVEGVTTCRFEHLRQLSSSGVKHAIVAAPELSQAQFAQVLELGGNVFSHLIVIPDTHFIWKIGAHTREVVGTLGLQLRNELLCPEARVTKRAIDLCACVLLAPLLLPVFAIVSAWIVLESGLPVFYSQQRLGHGGRVFRIWKFRTMTRNAAEALERALESSPGLRAEWEANHKLRHDPRVTAVGRLLRRTSLDELPQFWNVLKGEMSLVGPRPIVREEVGKYKEAYSLYIKTIPGLSGLWQVSGRNRTTYDERVAYDAYYVRNWSVWMDIYLIAKTVTVILTGNGAY